MRKFLERLFGKAAVVGFRSMFGMDRPIDFTILLRPPPPPPFRPDGRAVIVHPPVLDAETLAKVKAEWERAYTGRSSRIRILTWEQRPCVMNELTRSSSRSDR